jgi:hypothetical protein
MTITTPAPAARRSRAGGAFDVDARPQEYERRVVGFFDEALAP